MFTLFNASDIFLVTTTSIQIFSLLHIISDTAFERIDPQGNFIVIENAGSIGKDQNMKNWSIRRKIDSKEDIVYKFSDNFVLQSGSCVRIFSQNGSIGLVNQKEALVADNIPTWCTDSHKVTRLLDANGGDFAIDQVDPQGNFIVIEDAGSTGRDQDMKNWSIRRKIDSKEDIVYKFPDNFVLQSRSCVRIFSR
ncbi:unnamed protein product, partial [Adineta steineri]